MRVLRHRGRRGRDGVRADRGPRGTSSTSSWPTTTAIGPQRAAASAADRFTGVQLDASDEAAVEELIARRALRRRPQRASTRASSCRSSARRSARRGHLPRHGHVAVAPPSRRALHEDRRQARRRAVRPGPEWEERGLLALVGMGVEPGLSDVFARYAADTLFSARSTRSGCATGPTSSSTATTSARRSRSGRPSRSASTRRSSGSGTGAGSPPSRSASPRPSTSPRGIGPVECVNVEHEEVLLVPRWVDAKRVTFKYGLGDEFIGVLKTLHKLGLDSTGSGQRRRGRRSRRATSSPPACPTRPSSAT